MKPSGIFTFLFTDIEGSTKLSQEFPDVLPEVLEKHNYILTNAIKSNNGFVFKIVGDSFCAAFENAKDAVNAAVNAQLNLRNEKFLSDASAKDEVMLKVRMGIHSGNVNWNGKEFSGYITLARTSRVMTSAYGEQILISNEAYELCKYELAYGEEKVSFRDLGVRRLKDVIQPIRLFQILSKGLREDFPHLKSLDARPNNLPIQLTNFIGRNDEMKQIKSLLKQKSLITLLGPGGTGKTRLALQIGADIIDEFENGVWFVELDSLHDPKLLPHTVMRAFGIPEQSKQEPISVLCEYLREKEMLLILDNCEHIVNACSELSELLLRKSPKLKILTTSRESLRCNGELTFSISSMKLPNTKDNLHPEQLLQYESVSLFNERALAINPKFRITNENSAAIAQICYQLDGIPLAIELAAVRIKILTVERIREKLSDRFKLLTAGRRTALPRQQTLKALIDWSYDLLSEHEKTLWGRLSFFNGGWSLESAEEICTDDKIQRDEIFELLQTLIEKSIIIYDSERERYRMLETLKQYGKEILNVASDYNKLRTRHLHYFMKLSEEAERELQGNEVSELLAKLEDEHNNFQLAIESSASGEEAEMSGRLATALGIFWDRRGDYTSGRRLLEIICNNKERISKSVIAKAQNWAGLFAKFQGDFKSSKRLTEESLLLRRQLGDKSGIAQSLSQLASLASNMGDYEKAMKYQNESLEISRGLNDKRFIAESVYDIANLEAHRGNLKQSLKFHEEALLLKRELDLKPDIASSLLGLGNVHAMTDNKEQAKNYYEECLKIYRDIGEKNGEAQVLNNLGNISDNYEEARKFHEESMALNIEMGRKSGIASNLNSLGFQAARYGNYNEARNYYAESLALFREMGYKRGISTTLSSLGEISFLLGKNEECREYFEESVQFARLTGNKSDIAYALGGLGKLKHKEKNFIIAKKLFEECLTLTLDSGNKIEICESLIGLAATLSSTGDFTNALKLLGAVKAEIKSIDQSFQKAELDLHKQTIDEIHQKLGKEEFDKYYDEGMKLTIEQASDLILKSL